MKYEDVEKLPPKGAEVEELAKLKSARDEFDLKSKRVASKYYKYRQLIPQMEIDPSAEKAAESLFLSGELRDLWPRHCLVNYGTYGIDIDLCSLPTKPALQTPDARRQLH